MHGRGVHLKKSTAAAGKAKSSSVSVKVRGEQMECPLALSVRLPPDPPHATGTMAPRRQHAGEEERTERRDESGLLPLKEGCVEARVRIVLRGVGEARGETGKEGVQPLCYPELCLCLIACLCSHCRNQFAIGTVEQREKEACQVGHT